ncbi:hypothetical protein ['Cynodon dactylon' phytoplasma]|uniref:hypothetical protein n=1 Tax='Cynodon dactylon' phytoplasma TaxID=295320 RepID=UPI001265B104|nr:hypothetical protein ['Cynodon dactylon' phytoplasma]KAB8122068.1 hypothetical protein F1741_00815 ['Cynodon dactylon' phytoplasma]
MKLKRKKNFIKIFLISSICSVIILLIFIFITNQFHKKNTKMSKQQITEHIIEHKNKKKIIQIPDPQVFQIGKEWYKEDEEYEEDEKDNDLNQYCQDNSDNYIIKENQKSKTCMIHKKWFFFGINGLDNFIQKIIDKNQKEIEKLKNDIDSININPNINSKDLEKIEEIKKKIEFLGLKTYGTSFYNIMSKEKKYLLDEDKILIFWPYENYTEKLKLHKIPENLDNSLYNTFNLWNGWEDIVFFKKSKESWLYNFLTIKQLEVNKEKILLIEFKGPKEFLEDEDEMDYYLGQLIVPHLEQKIYNFYFNPVLNSLSIY